MNVIWWMLCRWHLARGNHLFERLHHQYIARVLNSLDAPLLLENHGLFGGGTAIALRYGEFRESVDIDFLVSDIEGYRNLRQLMTSPSGIVNIISDGSGKLEQTRPVRADQYGIRTMLLVDNYSIKFEIILEGRIQLDSPDFQDEICGIATLTLLDMVTSKLLANSDRWRDDAVFSRDLIDLAMMERCMQALSIDIPKALLWQKIRQVTRSIIDRC